MSGENTRTCGVPTPPAFEFVTPQFQNAANTVYEAAAAYNTNSTNVARGKKYQFKSDFERMQYKIGQFNRAPNS